MRILGIDPGSVATGYGIVEGRRGAVTHVAHGTLRPPSAHSLGRRLAALHEGLEDVMRVYEPDVAVVERVFFAANARSALVLGQARGAVLAALGRGGLQIVELSAREVKQAVVGSGAASKKQVQAMVSRLLSLEHEPASDAADALAAAICHAHTGRLSDLGAAVGVRRRSRGRRGSRRPGLGRAP